MLLKIFLTLNFYIFLDNWGENNTFYKQKHYLGSRDKEFLNCKNIINIINDNLSIVKWVNTNDRNYLNNINYIVNKKLNIINTFDNNTELFETIAGVPFEQGSRNGYTLNSLFNSPESILYVKYSSNKYTFFRNNKDISLKGQNLKSCAEENKRANNINDILITFKNPNNTFIYEFEYLLISDTNNNCIRIIIWKYNLIDTVAGVCDGNVAGFKDGPLGINLLNKPKYLGIDEVGNIYIYDSGNNKIRFLIINFNIETNKITFDASLKTFINGNCMNLNSDYFSSYSSSSLYKFDPNFYKYSFCYNKWIENNQTLKNYYNFNNFTSFCVKKYDQCGSDKIEKNPILLTIIK